MVAARLTAVPGASDVFRGAVVAYADEVKELGLDVPESLLAEHGAVSAEVAGAMAEGVRARLGADVGVAVTGVAGPDGGTPRSRWASCSPMPRARTARRQCARSCRAIAP